MAIDIAQWKDPITLSVALLGAVLGVMNTWNAMNQRRVRMRVRPLFVSHMDGQPFGCSIEVINTSTFPLTVEEVGFISGRGRLVVTSPIFMDGKGLPRRLEPRESMSAMFGPREFGVPDRTLGDAYARTACGCLFRGNSPAGRQFSQMMTEIAQSQH